MPGSRRTPRRFTGRRRPLALVALSALLAAAACGGGGHGKDTTQRAAAAVQPKDGAAAPPIGTERQPTTAGAPASTPPPEPTVTPTSARLPAEGCSREQPRQAPPRTQVPTGPGATRRRMAGAAVLVGPTPQRLPARKKRRRLL